MAQVKSKTQNGLNIVMKSNEFVTESTDTLRYIRLALETLRYNHLTPQQVLDDHLSKHPGFDPSDKVVRDWMQWIEYIYPAPEATTLRGKLSQATNIVNGEFYHDEVEDAIRDRFGDKADSLSVDAIAKFINDGEWVNTGTL